MSDQPVPETPDDILTPLALSILRQAGPMAYRQLVVSGPTRDEARKALADVNAQQLLSKPVKDQANADAVLAALWFWNDALDEGHRIVQDIVLPTGSFWHAIMHRREGDFSNSKYWYRRCESHHVLKMMGAVASSLAGNLMEDRQVAHAIGEGWNPSGFVDLVQAVQNRPNDPRHELAIRLQIAEWEGLFNYCVHEAVATGGNDLDNWDRRIVNV